MPGQFITRHLETGTEDVFNEIAQIFRHDFVLYAGMLQSWSSLFEVEVPHTQPVFAALTRQLEQVTGQFLDDARPRLYPGYLAPQTGSGSPQDICVWWDRFYDDFSVYVRPKLLLVDTCLRIYLARPEFASVIQARLGPAAENERIDRLLLSAYNKLCALLDADHFDRRVAEMMKSRPAKQG
jgi:hypothetical protein